MDKQPRALYLLNFVSMWECFSFYGMRALLVLYMVHHLNYSDEKALALYALYIALVELGGVAGGLIADRYLGLRRAIVLGGCTIACGHIALALHDAEPLFFFGLGLIVMGTGFFRSNVAALLGHFYNEDDPRRARGYTLYYTGINMGGFLATILCAVVAELYGWHAGFSLAAFGMALGLLLLYFGRKTLGMAGMAVTAAERVRLVHMPGLKRLVLYLVFLVLFYMCEEQLGSSLVLFGERHVSRDTLFGTIPAASLITFNPLAIMLFGPLVAKIPLREITKVALSFLLLAAAFFVFYVGLLWDEVPLVVAVTGIVLISLGELLLGPTIYAAASAVPKAYSGLSMGVVAVGYSMANVCSGFLSQMMSVSEHEASTEVYMNAFLIISVVALAFALTIGYRRYDRYSIYR